MAGHSNFLFMISAPRQLISSFIGPNEQAG